MLTKTFALSLTGFLAYSIASCAAKGYTPRSVLLPSGVTTCSFFTPDQELPFLARLRSIAHEDRPLEGRASDLRTVLPKARTFADFHAALCFAAAQHGGSLSHEEYYFLLDTVAPAAVRARSRDAGADLAVAPSIVAPADSAVFDGYPRSTHVRWNGVDGAERYLVEVEILLPQPNGFRPEFGATGHVTTLTEDTFEFTGAQFGRWRVRGLDARGRSGPPSPWHYFRYLR